MDGETIRAEILVMPTTPLDRIANDSEIWEGDDGGAHFMMTRHQLPLENSGMDFFSLSISGDPRERSRLISEFCNSLGEPERVEANADPLAIDIVAWLVRRDAVK